MEKFHCHSVGPLAAARKISSMISRILEKASQEHAGSPDLLDAAEKIKGET
jgi:hypothetical protein